MEQQQQLADDNSSYSADIDDSADYHYNFYENNCNYGQLPRYSPFIESCILMTMLLTFCVVGIIGNALVLYVYAQKRDKQVANHFIIVLAVVDLTTCTFIIPATMYLEYYQFNISIDFFCKLYQFLITSVVPFSVLIMVAIAIDRYFCICHPFLQAMTLPRAKVITVAMACLAVILGIIVALSFGIYEIVPKYCADWITNQEDVNQSSWQANETHYYNYYAEHIDDSDEYVLVNLEKCHPNGLIVNLSLIMSYQKVYTTLYLISLVVIIVLYTLIYRLVYTRRAKRLQQQTSRLLTVNHDSTFSGSPVTDVVTINGDNASKSLIRNKTTTDTTYTDSTGKKSPGNSIRSLENSPLKLQQEKESPCHTNKSSSSCPWPAGENSRQDSRERRMRRANLKTAAMLFVVTVVFVLTYMPAFFMSMGLIPIWRIVFYLYFANNVANPVIYSFMNTNFREDLAKIFSRKR